MLLGENLFGMSGGVFTLIWNRDFKQAVEVQQWLCQIRLKITLAKKSSPVANAHSGTMTYMYSPVYLFQ